MSVSEGLERTIAELGLGEEHAALVEAARGLAAAVEENPGRAALWHEFLVAVGKLMEAEDGVDDDSAEFLGSVRAPVGNGKN